MKNKMFYEELARLVAKVIIAQKGILSWLSKSKVNIGEIVQEELQVILLEQNWLFSKSKFQAAIQNHLTLSEDSIKNELEEKLL